MMFLAFTRRCLFTILTVLCCSGNYLKSEALVLKEEFGGKIVTDVKVNLPADDVWAVYKSRDFGKLLLKLAPSYYKQIDYVTGNGGVGTVLNVTLQPAFGSRNWLDMIIEINDKAKTVLTKHVKGTYVDAGFTLFQNEARVIKKEKTSCIIRTTTSLKLSQQSLDNANLVKPFWLNAVTVADYVNSIRPNPLVLVKEFRGEIVDDMKVNLPANEVWDVFRSKEYGHLLLQLSQGFFKQVDYINGDGGLGTVLNISLSTGSGWLADITVLNDKTMTRVLRHIKGGILDSGFTEFETGYRVIKKANKYCVIRVFVPFKVRAESLFNTSLLQPDWNTAMSISNYVNSMKL